MHDSDYNEFVAKLAKDGDEVILGMDPLTADRWHAATGVCTEAGELLSSVKKEAIYGAPSDRENVLEELGDIEFYLAFIRMCYHLTRDEVLEANHKKLNVRYSDGYSDEAAQNRADKVSE